MPKATAQSTPEIQQPHIPCPQIILDKVRQFDEQLDTYKSGDFSEAQLRIDYINPMLKALGWDVDNTKEYAEAYRDVVYEDALKMGGTQKAPDYGFYIGGRAAGGGRKFFLEAKKPSVHIHLDPKSAFQLRRYAYSAQLPLSILTNFKDFFAYDTRFKPSNKDGVDAAAVFRIKYTEYPVRWHEIASVFSREAILRGAFDKFAQGKRKKGIEPLGESFLKDIESWRELLAKDIASNNDISVDELNFAVQRTIDRILFLRICEDRGIEPVGALNGVTSGEKVYSRLGFLFRAADDKYNSGIFHFPAAGKKPDPHRAEVPDDLTLDLNISDKPLQHIIRGLYDSDKLFASYAFAVIPPEILGQVYERFLGKVITLKTKHTVKIEEKPEVRKAGGVYYTPTYIVDYIVKNTVGKLLEGKEPKDAAKITILDPASGSGSFLIGAYQFLLDWHLKWYIDNDPEKHCKGKNPPLTRVYVPSFGEEPDATPKKGATRDYRLTTNKRKEILLNSIYGVDIDSQAVEVTKLSLLLKVLEGESKESVAAQLKFNQQRALPDLGRNIKCGNSLIGEDFDDSELSEDERKKINKFNWQREFPQIFKRGGFDAVIGNPPYVRSQTLDEHQRAHFGSTYSCATATFDIYVLFVEKAHDLIAPGGRAGLILPNKFFTTDYGAGLRRLLHDRHCLESLVDFEDAQVFEGAGTYTTLLFTTQSTVEQPMYVSLGDAFQSGGRGELSRKLTSGHLPFRPFTITPDGSRWTLAAAGAGPILTRLAKQFGSLHDLNSHIFQGLKTSADKTYLVRLIHTHGGKASVSNLKGEQFEIETAILKPVVKGEHVRRYSLNLSGKLYIVYPYELDAGEASLFTQTALKSRFPLAWKYLKSHKNTLGARDKGKWATRADWYAYARAQNLGAFVGFKFLIPYMATRLNVYGDAHNDVFFVNITTGGYGMRFDMSNHDSEYFTGLLNSRLLDFAIKQMTNRFRGGYFAFNKQALERLPIRTIDFKNKPDKAAHDRMVKLVDRMLELHKKLAAAKSPIEKERLPREIEAADRQIDQLVYELYGLTEDEIKIVEEATTSIVGK